MATEGQGQGSSLHVEQDEERIGDQACHEDADDQDRRQNGDQADHMDHREKHTTTKGGQRPAPAQGKFAGHHSPENHFLGQGVE
jgi:hypothetical protein